MQESIKVKLVVKCAGVSPGMLEFRKQKAKHTPTLHGVRHSLRSVDGALSVGLAHALAVRRSARVAAQLLVDRHVTTNVLAHDRRDLYACQCTCMTGTGLTTATCNEYHTSPSLEMAPLPW